MPFAALTMRSLNNERNDFLLTTFPTADVNWAAPAPIVFPQPVAGGGFGVASRGPGEPSGGKQQHPQRLPGGAVFAALEMKPLPHVRGTESMSKRFGGRSPESNGINGVLSLPDASPNFRPHSMTPGRRCEWPASASVEGHLGDMSQPGYYSRKRQIRSTYSLCLLHRTFKTS